MDDAFGEAQTGAQTQIIVDNMTLVGMATATVFDVEKTHGPVSSLVILVLLYWSVTQSCRLGEKKRTKYIVRMVTMIRCTSTSSKELVQLIRNLGNAEWV